MAVMMRSHHPRELEPGLNAVFGESYDRLPDRYKVMFTKSNSDKAYEEDVLVYGLGAAPVKSEGGAITYDQGGESYVARYKHVTIALAFAITQEAMEDNLYGQLGDRYSRALARSMKYTKEVHAHSVLNDGFTTNGPDGVPLFSTGHPLANGGTLSNRLTTGADISEDSLEDAFIAIRKWTDDRGIPIMARPKVLFVPVDQEFVAKRVLMTTNAPGTANNDINAIKGVLPGGYECSEFLSDDNAWFIKTDVDDGLKHFERVGMQKGMEGDFETGNMRYKARERYSFGYSDWRGVYGSPGSS